MTAIKVTCGAHLCVKGQSQNILQGISKSYHMSQSRVRLVLATLCDCKDKALNVCYANGMLNGRVSCPELQ